MMDKIIIAQLEKIAGRDGVLTSPEDLAVYSYDGTFEQGCPDVVVLPRSTDQVSQLSGWPRRLPSRWFHAGWDRAWQAVRCHPRGGSS